MAFRHALRCLSAASAAFLVSCGGGGGENSSGGTAPPAQVKQHIVGSVWIGPVAGSLVTAYRLTDPVTRVPLASATSTAGGGFSMDADAPAGTVIQLEAIGGTYMDSAGGLTRTLDVPLRLTFVAQANNGPLTVSALSEIATRGLANQGGDLVAVVLAANSSVATYARIPDIVSLDLGGACKIAEYCEGGIVAATVSVVQRRWGLTSLEAVLQRLAVIWSDGPYDDRAVPELVRAEYDQSQGADPTLRGWVLGSISAIDDADLQYWLPHGSPGPDPSVRMADGTYTALINNSATRVVQATHQFNGRGALSSIQGISSFRESLINSPSPARPMHAPEHHG